MNWVTGNITEGWTSSSYYGFGIPFEELSETGEHGGSPLLNDGGVPGDEVRWELVSVSGLTIEEFNEDGSIITSGTGSIVYATFIGNVFKDNYTYRAILPGKVLNYFNGDSWIPGVLKSDGISGQIKIL